MQHGRERYETAGLCSFRKTSRACTRLRNCVAKFGILKYTSSPGSKHHNYPMLSTNHMATPYAVLQSHPIYLSIYLSIYLASYLSIYLYIYICIYIYIMCMCIYIYISDVRGCWQPRVRQCQPRTHN